MPFGPFLVIQRKYSRSNYLRFCPEPQVWGLEELEELRPPLLNTTTLNNFDCFLRMSINNKLFNTAHRTKIDKNLFIKSNL